MNKIFDVIKAGLDSMGYKYDAKRRKEFFRVGNKIIIQIYHDTFDYIVRKEDVHHKKPHPEVYLNVLEHYQANPMECIVFEDSLHGIMAAREAGIETVNVYDKYSDGNREAINKLTDYRIDSFYDFINAKLGGDYGYTKSKHE